MKKNKVEDSPLLAQILQETTYRLSKSSLFDDASMNALRALALAEGFNDEHKVIGAIKPSVGSINEDR